MSFFEKIRLILSRKKVQVQEKPDSEPGAPFPNTPLSDLQYDGLGSFLSGRKRYAVGLSWEPLQSDVPVKRQAERGDRSGYRRTLYVPFGGQAGFASKERQNQRSDPVLITAARTELLGETWVGAFKVNESDRFWWVAAVRNGEVYEDSIYPDEASARTQLMEALDAPNWKTIVAPEDWQVFGSVEGRIEQVFDLNGGQRLLSVYKNRDLFIRIGVIGAFLVIVGGAFFLWMEMKKRAEEREAEIRRIQNSSIRFDPMKYPWANTIPIERFIDICLYELEKSVYVVPGWANVPLSCVLNGPNISLTTEWTRTGGRISWLRAATAAEFGDVRLVDKGNRAILERQVPIDVQMSSAPDTPWNQQIIENTLISRFQTLGLTVNLRPRVRTLTATQMSELRNPVFNRHDVLLDTTFGVKEYGQLLSDIPALVPEGLVYALDKGVWSLTAKIYHPPILPPSPPGI